MKRDEPKNLLMSLVVNGNQRGNPVLRHLKQTFEFKDIVPDYQIEKTGILYLSLRYHQLHPEYVFTRSRKLGLGFKLRILLILVDIDNPNICLKELNRVCIDHELTLILSWTEEEAARYIDHFTTLQFAPPDAIQTKVDQNDFSKLTHALTEVKSVNKTDVMTLVSHFGVNFI